MEIRSQTSTTICSEGKLPISIVVPTFGREAVLLDTIAMLLNQSYCAAEILIVDQTPIHEPETSQQLSTWHENGEIKWIRRSEPSIPKAMNDGLRQATQPVVLFLDDDITASDQLVAEHANAHMNAPKIQAFVGQVLQPGETPQTVSYQGVRTGLWADLEFPFYSNQPTAISNVMAGNLSVKRTFALEIGGFDENFTGVAYRFETEFARRLISNGGQIEFLPDASINHLRAVRGGTRSSGSHLTSADPKYGTGDYYFAFLCGCGLESYRYSFYRLYREVRTRFHLTHPWWIPVKLLGEMRAFVAGRRMAHKKRSESHLHQDDFKS